MPATKQRSISPVSLPESVIGAEVWTLKIDHRHGANLSVHATEQGARDTLFIYVSEWWQTEIEDDTMPVDHEAAIKAYFEQVEDESADIQPATLEE